jgi:hypothetical protein
VDHVKEQGTDRRKSAAYTIVCEHFEEFGNPPESVADYLALDAFLRVVLKIIAKPIKDSFRHTF